MKGILEEDSGSEAGDLGLLKDLEGSSDSSQDEVDEDVAQDSEEDPEQEAQQQEESSQGYNSSFTM